jgi:hypothetical protein
MSEQIDAGAVELAETRTELRREAFEMALYVAICLLAALTAVSDDHTNELQVFEIVWGTTLGLSLAHWFAFNVSSRLVSVGQERKRERDVVFAQLAGAAAVAVIATIPVVLLPTSIEFDVVRFVLAFVISVVGYEVARSSGADRVRSFLYALAVMVVANLVVVIKNFLLGH